MKSRRAMIPYYQRAHDYCEIGSCTPTPCLQLITTPEGGTIDRLYLGTTRMSNSPFSGVVDENCQVYGVSNLFIASSSVFPTASYADPTLTIVALTIRLVDYLKQSLSTPSLYLSTRSIDPAS